MTTHVNIDQSLIKMFSKEIMEELDRKIISSIADQLNRCKFPTVEVRHIENVFTTDIYRYTSAGILGLEHTGIIYVYTRDAFGEDFIYKERLTPQEFVVKYFVELL